MYVLKRLTIFNLGFNINIINKKSRLKRYKNATPREYIWVGNNKAPVRGYGEVYIEVIIFEENKYNDFIIKIIRILNVTFYPFFVYNIIFF